MAEQPATRADLFCHLLGYFYDTATSWWNDGVSTVSTLSNR